MANEMPSTMSPLWLATELFLLIAACYGLSFAIMRSLHRLNRQSYRLFRFILLPGVMIHELSHAFACALTGTPIVEIRFWTETGGHVVHHKPRWPIVSQPIISLAPFIIGTLALVYLPGIIISSPWWLSILLVWILASVAATLAPSTTDLTHAAEGLFVVSIILGAVTYYFPGLINELIPSLTNLRFHLRPIVGLLAGIWIGLAIVRHVTKRS